MQTLEREIEGRLVTAVKAAGGLCLKWVCPGSSGVPDRIVLLPGGRIFFVELKRPTGGQLGKLQIWWQNKLADMGFRWYCIRSAEDIRDFIAKEVIK